MKRRIWAAAAAAVMLAGVVHTSGVRPERAEAAPAAAASPGGGQSAKSDSDVLDALFGGGPSGKDDAKAQQPQGGESGGKQEPAAAAPQAAEDDYFDALSRWAKDGIRAASGVERQVKPAAFRVRGAAAPLLPAQDSKGYGGPVFRWDKNTPEVDFTVDVPAGGLYNVRIDYYPLSDTIMSIERGIKVNGDYPYFQARQFELYKYWRDAVYPFAKDGLGGDELPQQKPIPGWRSETVEDPASADDRPLLFYLKQGSNTIALPYISEPVLLGGITVTSPEDVPSYKEYALNGGGMHMAPAALQTVEAERTLNKNEPFVRALADGSPSSVPFDSGSLRLNALGGDSWQTSGQSVTWRFEAPADGDYQLAFKYKHNTNTSDSGTDLPVYRTLRIDGAIPFEEMRRVAFPFANDWTNQVVANAGGVPYRFHLTKGEHTLTLTANDAPYRETITAIRKVMDGINDLAIEVKMATGNTQDANRDWDLTDQIPDAADRLNGFADELSRRFDALVKLVGRNPDSANALAVSADRLRNLAKEPNSLPYRYSQLSEGSGSIMQLLGEALGKLPNQPLTIDRFYVYSGRKLPSARASLLRRLEANAAAFFHSFTKDYSKLGGSGSDTLQIWVNRPRQYVTAMQQLANESFTKETGVKVSFSLMPDETKLILANAAGNSPDIALSINNTTPFNLAVRGTLDDLTQFPDYGEVVKRFSPGALLPFQFDGGTYALPETQNFWVLFYRKDILSKLHIPVPDTMDEVRAILPDLQRYGLNFYDPLSQTGGYKAFWLTVPFLYQNGGELFRSDGTAEAAIDTDNALAGIKQMSDLFTVYNLPLNVPSFYNHFRDGSLPIGIADFSAYVQLTSAAPEINGLWGIAPLPGVKDASGTVERWAPGTGQSTVIFKSSKHQEEAWQFLKWWTSAETQSRFGSRMQTIFGPTYRWNTANLEAFGQLPWPAEDIAVIEKQWTWLKDIPHVPGDYMLERGISDAWNKIVFDGVNPRRAVEDATITADREIDKKLEEFGYRKDGRLVKPLRVPQLPEMPQTEVKKDETGG
ncbi:extracellular solute-binding protein [Paenibacillus humicola]|uniref:extracellular solute-binding protein n=1 Tax=Paenibacillus humicola TaxID=3110540 RepID=UPI00237A4953|nr:extracellular solute-binding protein [Paenibacillus humicola]